MAATPAPLSLHDFQPLAGGKFLLRGPGPAAQPVELTSVRSLGFNTPPERGGRESFALLFHAPAGARLGQGTYGISHPQLGEHEIFLVPLGPDARGLRLEAIFNFA